MFPLELIDFQHGGRKLGRASRRETRAYRGGRGASGCCSCPCAGRPSRQRGGTRSGRRSSRPSNQSALLQELLASQQAVAARLTNVENNQAHPQLQQHQQAQPAHQPQQATLQLAGGSAQHSIREERRNTAGYGHLRRNGKRQVGGGPLAGQREAKRGHRPRRLQRLGGNKSRIADDRARYRGPRLRRCV